MSFLYLTGSRFNLFGRGTVSVSPTAATVSAAANAYDGDPGNPLLFGTATSGYVKVDACAFTNPGFETSTLSGWTDADSGTGASTETTSAGEFRSGTKALKLDKGAGTGTASRYQDFTVRAGEYRTCSVYIKTATSGTVNLLIYNKTTGKYWSGVAWGGGSSGIDQDATGSWVQLTTTYQVETFEEGRDDTMTLRVSISCSNGVAFCDDALDVPGVTFASIHGHNFTTAPTVESSDDDSSWTSRATMTIKRPAFFSTFSIVYARYWKIAWSYWTSSSAPYLGETVLGQYDTATTNPQWGIVETRDIPGVRTRGPSGRHAVYNYATDPPRSLKLTFSARTAAAARELSDSLWLRSGQGLYPTVIVPIDTETDVYYGRLTAPHEHSRPFQGVYESDLALVGDPFPMVTT